MTVTTTNLIQGPATLWVGIFGVAEPAAVATAPGTGWTELGATQGGIEVSVELTYTELDVDQVVDIPGQTLTKRVAKIKTNLAEATLINWVLSQNQLAADIATGAVEPANGLAAFTPNYAALLMDGISPGGFRRRFIARRCLQIGNPGLPYKKDGQVLIPVEYASHFVSSSIAPYKTVDASS